MSEVLVALGVVVLVLCVVLGYLKVDDMATRRHVRRYHYLRPGLYNGRMVCGCWRLFDSFEDLRQHFEERVRMAKRWDRMN